MNRMIAAERRTQFSPTQHRRHRQMPGQALNLRASPTPKRHGPRGIIPPLPDLRPALTFLKSRHRLPARRAKPIRSIQRLVSRPSIRSRKSGGRRHFSTRGFREHALCYGRIYHIRFGAQPQSPSPAAAPRYREPPPPLDRPRNGSALPSDESARSPGIFAAGPLSSASTSSSGTSLSGPSTGA